MNKTVNRIANISCGKNKKIAGKYQERSDNVLKYTRKNQKTHNIFSTFKKLLKTATYPNDRLLQEYLKNIHEISEEYPTYKTISKTWFRSFKHSTTTKTLKVQQNDGWRQSTAVHRISPSHSFLPFMFNPSLLVLIRIISQQAVKLISYAWKQAGCYTAMFYDACSTLRQENASKINQWYCQSWRSRLQPAWKVALNHHNDGETASYHPSPFPVCPSPSGGGSDAFTTSKGFLGLPVRN